MDQKEAFCQIDNHDQSPILGVCLQKDCNNPRQYCQYCQHDYHKDHFNEIKPFKYLEEIIKERREIYQIIQQQVKEIRKVVDYFEKVVTQMNIDNNQLKSLNPQQYNTLVENIFYIESFKENLLEKIFDQVNDLQNSADILKQIYNKSIKNKKGEQDGLQQQLVSQEQKVEPIKKKIGYYFQKLLFDFLTYKNDFKTLKIQSQKYLVCLEPEIKVNSIKTVKFLFESFEESYVGLFGNRVTLIPHNEIQFDKQFAISQRAFLIDHKGNLITPDEPKLFGFGLFEKKFKISPKQIISLEADLKAGYLTFYNHQTNGSQKIRIDKSEDIFFCAGGLNCEVTIIETL